MQTTHRNSYLPSDIREEMEIIKDVFKERINEDATQAEIEALGEYYRMVQGRNLDAFEWLVEAILVTSKKEQAKRNIPYMAGMLRKWLVYGFGYIPSQEEEMLSKFIEDDFNVTLNRHARNILQELLGTYGAVNLARIISKEGDNIDFSVGIMLAIKNHIEYNTALGGRQHVIEEGSSQEG